MPLNYVLLPLFLLAPSVFSPCTFRIDLQYFTMSYFSKQGSCDFTYGEDDPPRYSFLEHDVERLPFKFEQKVCSTSPSHAHSCLHTTPAPHHAVPSIFSLHLLIYYNMHRRLLPHSRKRKRANVPSSPNCYSMYISKFSCICKPHPSVHVFAVQILHCTNCTIPHHICCSSPNTHLSQSYPPRRCPRPPPFPTMHWPLVDEHSATMLGGWISFFSIPELVFAWWRRLVWVWEHLPVLWGALQFIWRSLLALWEVWRMAKRGPNAWALCVFPRYALEAASHFYCC